MEVIPRLRKHYEKNPPRPSYKGTEGKSMTGKVYSRWPHEEETRQLGVGAVEVWKERIPATQSILPLEGYCLVDACLDDTGHINTEVLPLWPEMEGHELLIVIYVDMFDCTRMRAIGGFTSRKTRIEMLCVGE